MSTSAIRATALGLFLAVFCPTARSQNASHGQAVKSQQACDDLPGDGVLPVNPDSTASSLRTGIVQGSNGQRQTIKYSVRDGYGIFQGDIILGLAPDLERLFRPNNGPHSQSVIVSDPNRRWPDATIPYEIDPNLPNQQRVTSAILTWMSATNFNFVAHNGEGNFVYITTGSGCDSYLGMKGGSQVLHLADACGVQQAVHELGHAIGLEHEHDRSDRDQFITISPTNIPPQWTTSFQILDPGMVQNIGPYDYCSIMHYPRIAGYGNANLPVFEYSNQCPACIPGKGTVPSAGDISAVKSMYTLPLSERKVKH